MESILTAVKQMLGLPEDYTAFDETIVMHINSVFLSLSQMGVGPAEGFTISDKEAKWDEIEVEPILIGYLKTYMFMKVKLVFDPPNSSYLLEAIDRQILQMEWRMTNHADSKVPLVTPLEE
jgi:hypothetical protein